MVVSHYLVSGIQVAGLIVGLFGFFFLSMGLFGKHGVNIFRPLLPAAAMSCLFTFVYIRGLAYSSSPIPVVTSPITGAILGFIFGYMLGFFTQYGDPLKDEGARSFRRYGVVGLIALFMLVVFNIVATKFFPGLVASKEILVLEAIVGLAAAGAVQIGLIAAVAFITSLLSESALQRIGFVLSALAILTQFLPPVLDLLNISVK